MPGGGTGRARGHRGRFEVDRLHRPGVDPVRVLLLTDRAIAGDPDRAGESLPDEIAARLADRSGRAVDLDVLTDLTPALKAMGSAFRAWRAWRYDAVVVVLDTRAEGRGTVRRRIPRLLDDLAGAAVLPTPVVVAGLVEPGSPGRHREDDLVPASSARFLAPGSAVLVLAAVPPGGGAGRRRAVGDWGTRITEALTAVPTTPARSVLPQDEHARQRALDATGALHRTADPALQRIVALARDAFEAESAELNVLDHDRQWRVAVAGSDPTPAPTPRSQSICDLTIQRAAPTVIQDTRRDPRTAENPVVNRVGFYAAYPIESIEGYRIGALCVFDSRPRSDVTDLDIGLLRDFALLAEAELIDESRAGAP